MILHTSARKDEGRDRPRPIMVLSFVVGPHSQGHGFFLFKGLALPWFGSPLTDFLQVLAFSGCWFFAPQTKERTKERKKERKKERNKRKETKTERKKEMKKRKKQRKNETKRLSLA